MPIPDQELEAIHAASVGTPHDLLGELIEARKALVVAKKLAQLAPMVQTSLTLMTLQETHKPEELFLAIVHKKADGTGRVGPTWLLGEFLQNLEQLGKLLLSEDEDLELKATMLAKTFGGG